MKPISFAMLLVAPLLFLSCSKEPQREGNIGPTDTIQFKEEFNPGQLSIVTRHQASTIRDAGPDYKAKLKWLTAGRAQSCQRPLDIYLVKSQIGAFVDFANITPKDIGEDSKNRILLSLKAEIQETLAGLNVKGETVVVGWETCDSYMKLEIP